MTRVVGDAEFVFDQLRDFAGCPGLSFFEKSLKIARLLVGELRGRSAPEAWNQSGEPVAVPAFEPPAADGATGTNACSGFFDRISGLKVAHETESADDFLVVHLLDLCSQFLIREVSFNHSSSRSHAEDTHLKVKNLR